MYGKTQVTGKSGMELEVTQEGSVSQTGKFEFPRQLNHTFVRIEYVTTIGGSKGGRQGRAPPPGGPHSFIFMQFSAKN